LGLTHGQSDSEEPQADRLRKMVKEDESRPNEGEFAMRRNVSSTSDYLFSN